MTKSIQVPKNHTRCLINYKNINQKRLKLTNKDNLHK
jgi:hypothetical protein